MKEVKVPRSRNAIALLITLFFIMAITVAVGVSLTHFQKGRAALDETRFLVQSAVVVEDVMRLMKENPMVQSVKDPATLATLIDNAAMIPLEAENLRVLISVESARGRFNINDLAASKPFQEAFGRYLQRYNVQDISYLSDLLQDCMGGQQPYYRTEIFEEMPWLFRDAIASDAHFKQILDFYVRKRFDNSVNEIPWNELFRFAGKGGSVDVNHLTAEGWRFMLPEVMEEKIEVLVQGRGFYEGAQDVDLSAKELRTVESFGVTYYAPVVDVKIAILENGSEAEIKMEYAIDTKQAKVLTYDI